MSVHRYVQLARANQVVEVSRVALADTVAPTGRVMGASSPAMRSIAGAESGAKIGDRRRISISSTGTRASRSIRVSQGHASTPATGSSTPHAIAAP